MEAHEENQSSVGMEGGENIIHNEPNIHTAFVASHQVISFDVGLRHFAYCIMDVCASTKQRAIKHLEVVDLGCKKGNPQKVIDCVIDVLDEITYNKLDLQKKTIVLIECQMTAIMKCVQTVINAYFKITSKYSSMDAATFYMSAKHKLNLMMRYKDYPRMEESLVPISNPKNAKVVKYKKNKLDAVHFASWLIENKEHDLDMLERVKALKKKDDVCDAYLMAVFHIEVSM